MKSGNTAWDRVFDPGDFRNTGHQVVDLLADYLDRMVNRKTETVMNCIAPDAMLEKWPADFSGSGNEDVLSILQRILEDSNHLHHPGYVGHQVSVPLPLASICDWIGSLTNNSSAVFEMGPVNIALERRLIQWMAEKAGYGKSSDGIFTNGGTAGNLTALLAARQAMADYDVWTEGIQEHEPLTILVSEQSHYSVRRAASIMGLGEKGVAAIPVDGSFRMQLRDLESIRRKVTESGRRVLAVVGNACSTATGTYDDLEMIAGFAAEHGLWFHVDGAHGASALLSEKYRHLLKGLHKADSLVWDAHKMMMVPALATAVLFRQGVHSYESFAQRASYLFEKTAMDEWYNYAHRTLECTKTMMGVKLYVPLMVLGEAFFGEAVTHLYDLAREFREMLQASPDFEPAMDPQSNIVCFRYTGPVSGDRDRFQQKLRRAIREAGRFYVVQTRLNERQYLRCTIMNPLTTPADMQALLSHIREAARRLTSDMGATDREGHE